MPLGIAVMRCARKKQCWQHEISAGFGARAEKWLTFRFQDLLYCKGMCIPHVWDAAVTAGLFLLSSGT